MYSKVGSNILKCSSEIVRLQIGELGENGDNVAYYDDEPINVFGGIEGEEVLALIVPPVRRKSHHKKTAAFVTEVLTPSPYRVVPPCPYFGFCTGCQWQHIEYEHQLLLKGRCVAKQLRKFAELSAVKVAATRPAPNSFGYRNHGRFTVRKNGVMGYINRLNRRFVPVDNCMLMDPWINNTLGVLQGKCEETSQISIRYGVNTGEFLIQPTMHSKHVSIKTGQTHFQEKLFGERFRIASPSFFQVNTKQTERMVNLVRERLNLQGHETIVDAYAGIGTFAILLAPEAMRVIAVEESAAAVKDAIINAKGINNLEYRQDKVENVLGFLDCNIDALILDPPRVGCAEKVLREVVRRSPKKTIYISCDPHTLARDLRILANGGLSVQTVEPIDMFPQTHHVECIATITS